MPIWVLGSTVPWRCPGASTHLLQWWSGADKVKDEFVGILLHPGWDVSIHLEEGRRSVGGISAMAGGWQGTVVGVHHGGSLGTLTMTLRSL